MQHYLDMWKNFSDFSGTTSRNAFWMAVLFNFIISFAISFIGGMINLSILASVYTLAVLIPSLAMNVRRLRDAGCHWANIFWLFLPVIGTVIYIVKLCKPTASRV